MAECELAVPTCSVADPLLKHKCSLVPLGPAPLPFGTATASIRLINLCGWMKLDPVKEAP